MSTSRHSRVLSRHSVGKLPIGTGIHTEQHINCPAFADTQNNTSATRLSRAAPLKLGLFRHHSGAMKTENIIFGTLFGCGGLVSSFFLFTPRFRKYARWAGTGALM